MLFQVDKLWPSALSTIIFVHLSSPPHYAPQFSSLDQTQLLINVFFPQFYLPSDQLCSVYHCFEDSLHYPP